MTGVPPQTGTIQFKWDPKNLEIRTKSVELTLEPLVTQVTTLVNQNGPSNMKKGRSKKATVLSAAVGRATENFIAKGEEISRENPEMEAELMGAVEEVRQTGGVMQAASQDFAADPCSSMRRGAMVRVARALLSAVTRLLIIADMVDIHLLMRTLHGVEGDLDRIKNAANQQELMEYFKDFDASMADLQDKALRRQADLKDLRRRDDLAAARAVLKKNSMMLLTASKVYVRHPELGPAKANRDFAYRQVCDAVNTISGVAQATGQSQAHPYEGAGELAAALDELDEKIIMDPLNYNEVRTRPSLEERLESIISGAALMADSSCTRDERRERIVEECNAVRQALQDLLSQYMHNAGRGENSDALDQAIDNMQHKTRDLRRQLRKAVVDHVSDSFLETNVPLLVMIEAAKNGDERQVEEYARVFTEHANKLVEVANLACSMSNNEEGVKMVRLAAADIEILCPEVTLGSSSTPQIVDSIPSLFSIPDLLTLLTVVINAARILAARPRSKAAQENMELFQQAWVQQVRLLTETVDDITTIDDFLAVSESHILEDVNKCVIALQEGDADTLDRTAGAIRGRSARVCNVVQAEMDNYEPGSYTERVMESVELLREQVMPNFAGQVQVAVDALTGRRRGADENEFIDANRLVYDGVREIRQAVLMNRAIDEIESDTEFEYDDGTDRDANRDSQLDNYDSYDLEPSTENEQAIMRQLPHEDQIKIQQQVKQFREEKYKLDQEVAKWDDSRNDIVVLAKQMCMIMMEMTDFTRGRGPIKSTMHVISAAKKISEYGSKLDRLAGEIAAQCPDSDSKKDLEAYLQRTTLYCHQLNITSKVKADVQGVSGELILSGLDSATSLIQAAKNLMNTVVLVVKACYVASTKYSKITGNRSSVVQWKMKAPEKKPLVRRDDPDELRSKVRKSARRKKITPIKALSEFH